MHRAIDKIVIVNKRGRSGLWNSIVTASVVNNSIQMIMEVCNVIPSVIKDKIIRSESVCMLARALPWKLKGSKLRFPVRPNLLLVVISLSSKLYSHCSSLPVGTLWSTGEALHPSCWLTG